MIASLVTNRQTDERPNRWTDGQMDTVQNIMPPRESLAWCQCKENNAGYNDRNVKSKNKISALTYMPYSDSTTHIFLVKYAVGPSLMTNCCQQVMLNIG